MVTYEIAMMGRYLQTETGDLPTGQKGPIEGERERARVTGNTTDNGAEGKRRQGSKAARKRGGAIPQGGGEGWGGAREEPPETSE